MELEKPAVSGKLSPGGMRMIGTVLGELSFSRGTESVREHRWVQISAGGQSLAAVDLCGCRRGQTVLLTTGDAARLFSMDCPGDWAVAAVVAGQGNNG